MKIFKIVGQSAKWGFLWNTCISRKATYFVVTNYAYPGAHYELK
jgi:hypothetical protein